MRSGARNKPKASHPFEIPAELRNLAQKNVDQARKAFEGFVEAAQTATKNFEGTTNKLRNDTRDINTKALGYAEEDPTADIEGFDAAAKAAILASIAFRSRVVAGQVYREGISQVTHRDIDK